LWIGLNDMVTEGTFTWSNGDPHTYGSWATGEPNNNGGCYCNNTQGDYVAFTPATGKWFDRNICNKYGYVLEIGCINPVTMVQISGPASGTNFASGTTIPITYLAYTANGDTAYCSFNVIVAECPPVYCAAPNSSTQYEFIKKVEFNTISNLSGNNNGYGNFSTMSTTVIKGSIVPITLTPGFNSNCSYTEYWRVYIDWNYDGDFNDAFEMAASGFGYAVITKNITVPTSATVNKNLKMRIVMRYGSYPTSACPTSGCIYGETEDYTIRVENTSARSAEVAIQKEVEDDKALNGDLEISNLYPNPVSNNTSDINITYRIAAASNVKIQVLTMIGKVITEQNVAAVIGENRTTLQLPKLVAGTYLVNVANQNGQQSKKLIVE
jgi:GEVED domain/Secretion system C-terminal sorting domain